MVIRKGDLVKIVEPELFVRCGYPIDVDELCEKIKNEEHETIVEALRLMGCNGSVSFNRRLGWSSQDHVFNKTFERVARQVAYCRAKQERFGGPERRIHTNRDESFKGKEMKVCGIKVHKTGDYYAPHYHYGGMFGEDDYEPGGLTNMKSHRILGLCYHDGLRFLHEDEYDCRIEACHVQKLEQECGARFELANGETVTPCHLLKGHKGDHKGYCLGSEAVWPQGYASEYDIAHDIKSED